MDKKKILEDIFNNDPLSILNVKPRASTERDADERLLASFQEINDFITENGSEPEPNAKNVSETQLYYRLKSLKEDDEKVAMLKENDKHHILPNVSSANEPKGEYAKKEKKEINSIDDIFSDDSLGILGDDTEGLFEFKHTPKETTMPDYVASRKKCKDFEDFIDLFVASQVALKLGKRKLKQFRYEQQIDKGYFFVLKGVIAYVAEIGEKEADEKGKLNARLRVIFENGTESDMLMRSFSAELYKDGRRVTEHEDKMLDELKGITPDDKESGFIYVLESNSIDDRITSIKNLYKIGYSKTDIAERIKNAEKEPTYLMAPVKIMGVWQCFNMNPQKFEQLIHNFFGASCLDIDITDKSGKRHRPQEWFIAPLSVIEQAIELIINGKIVKYKYDRENLTIIEI